MLIAIREHLRHPSKSEIPGLMNGMVTFKEIYELRNSRIDGEVKGGQWLYQT
jgi:hypothetical protein